MTRINLVPVSELTDQHLMAEYRELPRVFGVVRKRIAGKKPFDDIPSDFRLGSGHVKFFYDKINFLYHRQYALISECHARGFKITNPTVDISGISKYLINDYIPCADALALSRARLAEKINMKPSWYKHYGMSLCV